MQREKLVLPQDIIDKIKTYLPPPRPPCVIFFKPRGMQIRFREGVLEGEDLAFFMQSFSLPCKLTDFKGWKRIDHAHLVTNCDHVDRCIALGFRFCEGGRAAYHAEKNFEMYR